MTNIIIAITVIVSLIAMRNEALLHRCMFIPWMVKRQHQYDRFISCGFVHANVIHLIFNMYALYLFGTWVERFFLDPFIFGVQGKWVYLLFYMSALWVCLLPTYFTYKNQESYASLGASGAVSALVFSFILLSPKTPLGLIFLPSSLHAPAYIFGLIYLCVSAILAKRGKGGINHSAHFWGALYGILFLWVICILFTSYNPILSFWNSL